MIQIAQPKLTDRFNVEFNNLIDDDSIDGNSISIQVISCKLPFETVLDKTNSTFQVVFEDDVENNVMNVLQKNKFKTFQCIVYFLNGENRYNNRVILDDCRIDTIGYTELHFGKTEAVTILITLKVGNMAIKNAQQL